PAHWVVFGERRTPVRPRLDIRRMPRWSRPKKYSRERGPTLFQLAPLGKNTPKLLAPLANFSLESWPNSQGGQLPKIWHPWGACLAPLAGALTRASSIASRRDSYPCWR